MTKFVELKPETVCGYVGMYVCVCVCVCRCSIKLTLGGFLVQTQSDALSFSSKDYILLGSVATRADKLDSYHSH